MNTVRRRLVDALHRPHEFDRAPSPPSDGGEGARSALPARKVRVDRPLMAAREAAHENQASHGDENRPGP